MFSKTCEYGIRATIFIASQSYQNTRVGLKDIAKKIDSPEAFTAKILQILSRSAIIRSIKGVGGGFEIPKETFKSIRNELAFMLKNTNLEELALGIKSGDTFLRY